jgi:hypothetical protein
MVVQARSTEVTARPSPLRFRTDTAAVVVVDMQNDFASPGGMFDRAGIDVRDIQAIVAPRGANDRLGRRQVLTLEPSSARWHESDDT